MGVRRNDVGAGSARPDYTRAPVPQPASRARATDGLNPNDPNDTNDTKTATVSFVSFGSFAVQAVRGPLRRGAEIRTPAARRSPAAPASGSRAAPSPARDSTR